MDHDHAQGNAGRSNLPVDQAQERRPRKGSAYCPVGNWPQLEDWARARWPEKVKEIAPKPHDPGGGGQIIETLLTADIRKALKQTAWDLPATARLLGISLAALDDALLHTRFLPRFLREIKRFPAAAPEYRNLTLKQIEDDIARRLVLYRADALESLHELAMMPIDENSANNQVKLAAANRLFQETGSKEIESEIDSTLRALNDEYHRAAPRIRSIRERTIEFESGDPKVIEGEQS